MSESTEVISEILGKKSIYDRNFVEIDNALEAESESLTVKTLKVKLRKSTEKLHLTEMKLQDFNKIQRDRNSRSNATNIKDVSFYIEKYNKITKKFNDYAGESRKILKELKASKNHCAKVEDKQTKIDMILEKHFDKSIRDKIQYYLDKVY